MKRSDIRSLILSLDIGHSVLGVGTSSLLPRGEYPMINKEYPITKDRREDRVAALVIPALEIGHSVLAIETFSLPERGKYPMTKKGENIQ